jgi:hypothetical protein
VNRRHLTDNPDSNLVSYTIDEPLGWITATAMFYSARDTRFGPLAAMKYNRFTVAR